jgi:hypothetical protein
MRWIVSNCSSETPTAPGWTGRILSSPQRSALFLPRIVRPIASSEWIEPPRRMDGSGDNRELRYGSGARSCSARTRRGGELVDSSGAWSDGIGFYDRCHDNAHLQRAVREFPQIPHPDCRSSEHGSRALTVGGLCEKAASCQGAKDRGIHPQRSRAVEGFDSSICPTPIRQ